MKLTTYTDYALRVLIYLGLKGDELATVREIADRFQISENHLMKVVHNLGKDGYIVTTRGRQGGIRLARPPKAIKIGEIARRYEEDMRIVECFDRQSNTCRIGGVCALAGYLDDALKAFLSVLDAKTLADLLKGSPGLRQQLLGAE